MRSHIAHTAKLLANDGMRAFGPLAVQCKRFLSERNAPPFRNLAKGWATRQQPHLGVSPLFPSPSSLARGAV